MEKDIRIFEMSNTTNESWTVGVPIRIMAMLDREGYYGIGAAVKDEDGSWYFAGALVCVLERIEDSMAFDLRLYWLYVEEEYRERGVARTLLERFFAIAEDTGAEDIYCDVPLSPECDALCALLEDHGFGFVVTQSPEFCVGRLDIIQNEMLFSKKPSENIRSLGKQYDNEAAQYLLDHNLESFIDRPWLEGRGIHAYERKLSLISVENEKLTGVLLADLDYAGVIRLHMIHARNKNTVIDLVRAFAWQVSRMKGALCVEVVIRHDWSAELWDHLFPGLEPVTVRRGMYVGE